MPGAADEPDAATLAALQVALLRSVLGGEPLPGTEQAVVLPDLAFVLREQGVVLSAEHLAGEVPAGALPVAVRVLPPDALAGEARRQGDLGYLRFAPPETAPDGVRLTLEARLATRDPDQRTLGLGGVQVTFQRRGDTWAVEELPALFAT